jgi:ESCRT-II complex subunit VPS22
MKKRAGLASLDKEDTDARFKSVGTDMVKTQHVQLSNQLETFQQALAAFASTHSAKIRANPEFRAEFARMCTIVGIDPLSSSASSSHAKWTAELGLGAIYFDLAVQVIEVCRRTRAENGGLISVEAATNMLNEKNRKFGSAEVGTYVAQHASLWLTLGTMLYARYRALKFWILVTKLSWLVLSR